jgi:hypothetical protein
MQKANIGHGEKGRVALQSSLNVVSQRLKKDGTMSMSTKVKKEQKWREGGSQYL